METRIGELRCKEVINMTDGSRYGYVGDAEVDLSTGQIQALIIPGRLRLFGLLGRDEDKVRTAGPGGGADLSLVGGPPLWRGHYLGGGDASAEAPVGQAIKNLLLGGKENKMESGEKEGSSSV